MNVIGLDHSFHRQLEVISQLFFEQLEIEFIDDKREDEKNNCDFLVRFELNQEAVQASAVLTDYPSNKTFDACYDGSEKIIKDEVRLSEKQIKHAVNYVYLTVLQDFTKVSQPWGTLTGIRPTKLVHKSVQKGVPIQEIHHQLQSDFLISEEKIKLMENIVERQLYAVPDLYDLSKEVSIYIGIPFCPTKCAYCTFPAYAINGRQGSVNSFLGGLHYEIQAIGDWLKENKIKVTTIYFGGGTPTSITAQEMDMLYERMYESIPMSNVREVTVEAGRPDTITTEKLEVLRKWEIDRISINPQSYTNETLVAIGRHHSVEETIEKFKLAKRMGMNNINMDLIIGLPGEGLSNLQHTLEETGKLMPESITIHTLSFKRASEMTKNKEKYKVAGKSEINQMMDTASGWMTKHGYHAYYLYRQKNILGNLENVGYALPGQESIYNIMIMEEKQTILGLGCGAASKFVDPKSGRISRYANAKDPKSYNEGYERYTEEKIKRLNELFIKDF